MERVGSRERKRVPDPVEDDAASKEATQDDGKSDDEEGKSEEDGNGLIKDWRSRWVKVSSGAAWVISVLVVFMDTLPATHPGTDVMTRFPQFLLAICFGLLLIAAHKWNRRRQLTGWVLSCVVCTVVGTAIYFEYADLKATSTEVWNDTRYVIGDLRTDADGVELQKACQATNLNRACDLKTLLDFCHGHLNEIWTPLSIARVQRRAVIYYVGASLFFMGAMVSLLHGLRWALPEAKKDGKGITG